VSGRSILLTATLLAAAGATSAEAGEGRRYAMESAIVHYDVEGVQKGTETLWFDRYGLREARERKSTLSFGGFTKDSHTLTIVEGQSVTNVDLTTKTATQLTDENMKKMLEASITDDPEKAGEAHLESMGGKRGGTDTVAGKTCTIWTLPTMNTRTCVWKGIPLLSEASMGNATVTMRATRVEEGASIPAARFALPAGVTMGAPMDLGEMMKKLQQGRPPKAP